jgi:hypothetical protein
MDDRLTLILDVHPIVFIDNVYNMVNDYLCDAADALESKISKSTKIKTGPNSVVSKVKNKQQKKYIYIYIIFNLIY